jgi:hypothetical protein
VASARVTPSRSLVIRLHKECLRAAAQDTAGLLQLEVFGREGQDGGDLAMLTALINEHMPHTAPPAV